MTLLANAKKLLCLKPIETKGVFGLLPQRAALKVRPAHQPRQLFGSPLTFGRHRSLPCRFAPIACRLAHANCGEYGERFLHHNMWRATLCHMRARGFLWPASKRPQSLQTIFWFRMYLAFPHFFPCRQAKLHI